MVHMLKRYWYKCYLWRLQLGCHDNRYWWAYFTLVNSRGDDGVQGDIDVAWKVGVCRWGLPEVKYHTFPTMFGNPKKFCQCSQFLVFAFFGSRVHFLERKMEWKITTTHFILLYGHVTTAENLTGQRSHDRKATLVDPERGRKGRERKGEGGERSTFTTVPW